MTIDPAHIASAIAELYPTAAVSVDADGVIHQQDATSIDHAAVMSRAVELAKADTIRRYESAVKARLDQVARARGYDSIISACSYAGANNPYQTEAAALLAWRAAVWQTCYAILADVEAGHRAPPSIDDMLAELPAAPG